MSTPVLCAVTTMTVLPGDLGGVCHLKSCKHVYFCTREVAWCQWSSQHCQHQSLRSSWEFLSFLGCTSKVSYRSWTSNDGHSRTIWLVSLAAVSSQLFAQLRRLRQGWCVWRYYVITESFYCATSRYVHRALCTATHSPWQDSSCTNFIACSLWECVVCPFLQPFWPSDDKGGEECGVKVFMEFI